MKCKLLVSIWDKGGSGKMPGFRSDWGRSSQNPRGYWRIQTGQYSVLNDEWNGTVFDELCRSAIVVHVWYTGRSRLHLDLYRIILFFSTHTSAGVPLSHGHLIISENTSSPLPLHPRLLTLHGPRTSRRKHPRFETFEEQDGQDYSGHYKGARCAVWI